MKALKSAAFYVLVAFIVFIAVFPFYYAIITSFKTGTALFQIDYWPTTFSLDNYRDVFNQGGFFRNILNSVLIASVTVCLSLFVGSNSFVCVGTGTFSWAWFVADDHFGGVDVSADCGVVGLV